MSKPKPKATEKCNLICCKTPPGAVEKIRADLAEWRPGQYAEEVAPGPTCSCNVRGNKVGCYKHAQRDGD